MCMTELCLYEGVEVLSINYVSPFSQERETDRQTETQTHRNRQTDTQKQTDRQTQRQAMPKLLEHLQMRDVIKK